MNPLTLEDEDNDEADGTTAPPGDILPNPGEDFDAYSDRASAIQASRVVAAAGGSAIRSASPASIGQPANWTSRAGNVPGDILPNPGESFPDYEQRANAALTPPPPASSTPSFPALTASTSARALPRSDSFQAAGPATIRVPSANTVSLTDLQGVADRNRANAAAAQAREADRLQRLDRTKAAVYGAGRGAAFLAGAPAGAGIGAEIGSLAGPVGTAAGGIIGGLITGTAAAWGADKGARLLAEHSDTVRGFTQAADDHPVAAGMGEIVTGLSGVPRAATQAIGAGIRSAVGQGTGMLARAGGAVANGYEVSGGGLVDTLGTLQGTSAINVANGATPTRNAAAFFGEAGARAATAAALDTALKEGARSLGISDQGQSWDGAAMAGLMGAFTTLHGVRVGNYSNAETASLLARGRVREMVGADLQGTPLVPSQVPGYGRIPDPMRADFLRPLTPAEAEAYAAAAAQVRAALAGGQRLPRGTGVTVDQATRYGQPTGQSAARLLPAPSPASFRGP